MKIDCCIIHSRLWVIHWVCGSLRKQCIPGLVWANGFSQVDGVSAPAANQVIARETFASLRQKTTRLFLYFCHQTSGWNKLKTVELFQETLNWQHMSDSSGRPIITPPIKGQSSSSHSTLSFGVGADRISLLTRKTECSKKKGKEDKTSYGCNREKEAKTPTSWFQSFDQWILWLEVTEVAMGDKDAGSIYY